jgi:type II secretory pathway pseudopilin PulG
MRKAFSMITAIFVILILSIVAMSVLNLSAATTNSTVDQYRHEQAALYAKSFTELAILRAIQMVARPATCTQKNTDYVGSKALYNTGSGYEANTSITFVQTDTALGCTIANTSNIIVDTTVQYRNPIDPANAPITTYFKRTLQKI